MAIAKCRKCGGSSTANTYEQARKQINHAVGLTRGIKCGDNYNCVYEVNPQITKPVTPKSINNIMPEVIPDVTPQVIPDIPATKPKEKKSKKEKKKQTS